MRNKIIVIGLIVVIIAIVVHLTIFFGQKETFKQLEEYKAVTVFAKRYNLHETTIQELEEKMAQLDKLIVESFMEAITSESVNQATAHARYQHMQGVSYMAMELMIAYEEKSGIHFTEKQAENLLIASYLHDIRKYAEGNHAKQGEKYVIAHLPSYITIDEADLEMIGTLIRYHSKPLTNEQRDKLGEAAILIDILQDADTGEKILTRGQSAKNNLTNLNLKSSQVRIKEMKQSF